MFNNCKFVSCGVANEIPPLLQLFMWELIRQMPVDKDYLQVFSLSSDNGKQKIKHHQEVPEYCKEYVINMKPVTNTIYVIDDETHSTMLLAEEY